MGSRVSHLVHRRRRRMRRKRDPWGSGVLVGIRSLPGSPSSRTPWPSSMEAPAIYSLTTKQTPCSALTGVQWIRAILKPGLVSPL
jgi:hypothetical protein